MVLVIERRRILMKKKLILTLFIFGSVICVACSTEVKEKEAMQQEMKVDNSYVFDAKKIKNSGNGIYTEKIISNKRIALEYSNMILEKILEKDINEYKEVNISYDTKKEIWVLTYSLGKETLGGDVNVAIEKKRGEILLIWLGE